MNDAPDIPRRHPVPATDNEIQPRVTQRRPRRVVNGRAKQGLLPGSDVSEQAATSASSLSDITSSTTNHIPDSQSHLVDGRFGHACALVTEYLDKRIASGDLDLLAVKLVIQRCQTLVSEMPPLFHMTSVPLRADDRLYALFDQILGLLRQQESQMQELQMMINELI